MTRSATASHDGARDWDVIVIGSGIGGLVTASQLAVKGATVLVLERYLIPGGSGGSFQREGYTFDVGASMIFGFGEKGRVESTAYLKFLHHLGAALFEHGHARTDVVSRSANDDLTR